MNDAEIEKEIQAKGLTAPRVTPQRIEEVIASEHYFTAAQGASRAIEDEGMVGDVPDATVIGESACASPENFNAELGHKIARANAVQKIWPLEGYLLRQRLHDQTANAGKP